MVNSSMCVDMLEHHYDIFISLSKQIYKTLQDSRPRPGQLMRVEGIAMKEVWKVAQGIKIAEKALADFFVEASAVPCNSDFRFANQFGE